VPSGLIGPLGYQEILLILVVLVFLFGARRIPEIARGLGEGIRSFRSSLKGGEEREPDRERPERERDKPRSEGP
jgi:sec-independent protein translocase protein TatA